MVYFEIQNCNICGAEQVDTTVLLTNGEYFTVCRNCYKLIRNVLKECESDKNFEESHLKSVLLNHIQTRTNKYPEFFKLGRIMKILKFYSQKKELLKTILENKHKKGITPIEDETYSKFPVEGKLKYEYKKGDVNDWEKCEYWNTNETEVVENTAR